MLFLLAADPSLDPAAYGVAGTTIVILLYGIKVLWSDNRALRAENNELAAKSLDKITVVATEASHQLSESSKSLEAATVMLHQIAGLPRLSPEQLYEVALLLRELKERRPS